MRILFKYACRNLKLNKKRTIATIVGALLATVLIYLVLGAIDCLKKSNYENAVVKNGDYHAYFPSLTNDEVGDIKSNGNIVSNFEINILGYVNSASILENTDVLGIKILSYQKSLENKIPIVLIKGDYPKKNNEIVIPNSLYKKNNYKIGDKVILNISDIAIESNDTVIESEETEKNIKEYVIVGVVDDYSNVLHRFNEDFYYVFYTVPSKNDKIIETDLFVRYNEPKKASILSKEIIMENNLQNNCIMNEEVINASIGPNDKRVYILILIIICIIIEFGIFSIKNAFSISVVERYKQFGMLLSIGATKRQAKLCIIIEAAIIALLAIPLGLIFALLLLYLLVSISNYVFETLLSFKLYYSVSIVFIILTSLISFITILLSSYLPALKMSKISAIELIKCSNSIKVSKGELKVPKYVSKFWGIGGEIAYKNLKRNGKKAQAIIDAIVICVALFIGFASLLPSTLDFEFSNYDILIKYQNDNWSDKSKLYSKIDSLANKFSEDGEISDYVIERSYRFLISDYSIYNNNYLESEEFMPMLVVISITNNDYKKLLESNNLKFEKNVAILVDDFNTKGGIDSNKLEKMLLNQYENNLQIKILDRISKEKIYWLEEYTVPVIIVSDEVFDEMTNNEEIDSFIAKIKVNDRNNIDISKYDDKDLFFYTNVYKDNLMIYSLSLIVIICMYVFLLLLAIIAFTNIFNIITTNIILRSREIAMLKSIGMTKIELKKMIKLESYFYSLKSLVIGVPLGILLTYVFTKAFEIKYKFPILTIIGICVCVHGVICVIMNSSLKKVQRDIIIDTIKNDNI